MITLENLFDFFEFIAEENTYIQHTPGSSGSANRFSRFPIESATGQLSNLGFPRLEVVQLPTGLFNDFDSSQQDVMAVRVRVIYRLPDKHDYNTEVTYLDNSKKALMQMLAYILDAQEDNAASCLLCAFDLSTARYNFIDKATFSGTAVGCELSINFKQYIDWENVTYGDFPQYDGTIALPTTPGSYMLRLLNGVYSWVTASASTTWGSITGTLSNQTDLQNALNAKQGSLGYTPENVANKTDVMSGNTTSSVKYLSAKGVYDWVISLGYQVALTAANFGAFINGLTGKTTPIDADYLTLMDSAASNTSKKLSWANLKATLKTYFDGYYNGQINPITQFSAFTHLTEIFPAIGAGAVGGGVWELGNGWVLARSSTAAVATPQAAEPGRPGIVRCSTGNTNSYNQIRCGDLWVSSAPLLFQGFFRIQTLSGGGQLFVIFCGFMHGGSYVSPDNAIRIFLTDANVLQVEVIKAGVALVVNTGITVAIDTDYDIKITKADTTNECQFYVNGVNVYSLTNPTDIATYVPIDVTMEAHNSFLKTGGSAARTFDVDYAYVTNNIAL